MVEEPEAVSVEINKYAEINDSEAGEVRIDNGSGNFNELDYIKSNQSWTDLHLPSELISQMITKGFKHPSRIQSSVIGLFQKGIPGDILAQSQNGSGKTLAFVIPSILIAAKNGSSPAPQ